MPKGIIIRLLGYVVIGIATFFIRETDRRDWNNGKRKRGSLRS